jgi:hypothetical protein
MESGGQLSKVPTAGFVDQLTPVQLQALGVRVPGVLPQKVIHAVKDRLAHRQCRLGLGRTQIRAGQILCPRRLNTQLAGEA